ncbi:cytochrome-c peroxidase [Acetobacter sacchari]
MRDCSKQTRFLWKCVAALTVFFIAGAHAQAGGTCQPRSDGSNPCPVALHRPDSRPLSAMAQIGRAMFYDTALSGSGRLSCASCHDPENHYGPSGAAAVFLGGTDMKSQGRRAVPSLMYLERQPAFSIGPDDPLAETAPQIQAASATTSHGPKSAANTAASAANLVPQGGLFWDGRADTFQQQATGPLYDPVEMASTREKVLDRLNHAPYTAALMQMAGVSGEKSPDFLLDEAMFALSRYQVEEKDFHPYSSKFDSWLEGRAKFTSLERRGYLLFNDPEKGNCAACHVDTPQANGLPPLFTDHQYEALGAPRNLDILMNRDASHYDLGVCDAQSAGRKALAAYCGMFATPTLRNSATRKVFFHNGVFHSLDKVLEFYALRDIDPARFYGRDSSGNVRAYDDLPQQYRANLDTTDAPLDRKPGDQPGVSEDERAAIIAFLKTLTDRHVTTGHGAP